MFIPSRKSRAALIVGLLPLLALMPLLHAHPLGAIPPTHPSGFRAPNVDAAVAAPAAVAPASVVDEALSLSPEPQRLPTIVVEESRQRTGLFVLPPSAGEAWIGAASAAQSGAVRAAAAALAWRGSPGEAARAFYSAHAPPGPERATA